MKVTDDYDVGVIVGRFQVPELHEAHRNLIQHVADNHDKVIVVLGLSPLMGTKENPLDFESRKQMILQTFPKVNVLYIKDVNSDIVWSNRLDEMVKDLLTPIQTAVLYGSRDSFIAHYTGGNATRELESDVYISGTEIRKNIAKRSVKAASDFREGVIWASQARFPMVISTVDVVIFNEEGTKLLLAQKPNEKQWRVIGGFTDPRSASDEEDALREVKEEADIDVVDLAYAGSFAIDDFRYRGTSDTIRTHLFTAVMPADQVAKAGDDIARTKWFWLPTSAVELEANNVLDIQEDVQPEHRKLVNRAINVTDPRYR